jgi:hypothetical protein
MAPPPAGRGEPSLDDLLREFAQGGVSRPQGPAIEEAAPRAPLVQAPAPVPPPAPAAGPNDFDRMLREELDEDLRAPAAAAPARAPAPAPAPLDPFEAELAREAAAFRPGPEERDWSDDRIGPDVDDRQAAYADPQAPLTDPYPEPPQDPVEDLRSLEPQGPRKGLVVAALLLGVAVVGVGAVIGLRSMGGGARTGEPPVISAEAGPIKVAPQNPGGVEIPNQNKQIYERGTEPPAASRVVTREEQPIDVQAATRNVARVILPGPGSGPADASAPLPSASTGSAAPADPVAEGQPAASLAPVLGEPRRVRTVSVRPDGTIAPVNGGATPATPATSARPAATPAPATSSATAPAALPATSPATPPAAVTAPLPPARAVAAATERPRAATPTPAAAPAPAAVQAPAQVASLPPAQASAPEPSGSGFMIQLAAPGSEAEARATFATLQRRFPDQLSGTAPVVRRAEVTGGRTVYRLRVGPFQRDDATARCEALKAAGGQCFIARN